MKQMYRGKLGKKDVEWKEGQAHWLNGGKEKGRKGRLRCLGTWQHSLFRGGIGVPQVPVTRILFKGVHESMEVGQFV